MPEPTPRTLADELIEIEDQWGAHNYRPLDVGIVCENNFHGRTTTICGFSSETLYKDGFGPFTPGFVSIPFGNAEALANAITPNTCGFLFEPIQCEAGILIPPEGYLRDVAAICR